VVSEAVAIIHSQLLSVAELGGDGVVPGGDRGSRCRVGDTARRQVGEFEEHLLQAVRHHEGEEPAARACPDSSIVLPALWSAGSVPVLKPRGFALVSATAGTSELRSASFPGIEANADLPLSARCSAVLPGCTEQAIS
jgi:hypothetical protein